MDAIAINTFIVNKNPIAIMRVFKPDSFPNSWEQPAVIVDHFRKMADVYVMAYTIINKTPLSLSPHKV